MSHLVFVLAGVFGCSLGLGALSLRDDPPPAPAPDTLPILRLAAPKVDARGLQRLAKQAFGLDAPDKRADKDRLRLKVKNWTVELYRTSGGIWAADRTQLWNPNLTPNLPTAKQARDLADKFLVSNNLLPTLSPEVA